MTQAIRFVSLTDFCSICQIELIGLLTMPSLAPESLVEALFDRLEDRS